MMCTSFPIVKFFNGGILQKSILAAVGESQLDYVPYPLNADHRTRNPKSSLVKTERPFITKRPLFEEALHEITGVGLTGWRRQDQTTAGGPRRP